MIVLYHKILKEVLIHDLNIFKCSKSFSHVCSHFLFMSYLFLFRNNPENLPTLEHYVQMQVSVHGLVAQKICISVLASSACKSITYFDISPIWTEYRKVL